MKLVDSTALEVLEVDSRNMSCPLWALAASRHGEGASLGVNGDSSWSAGCAKGAITATGEVFCFFGHRRYDYGSMSAFRRATSSKA
jgi:hypothetical protein